MKARVGEVDRTAISEHPSSSTSLSVSSKFSIVKHHTSMHNYNLRSRRNNVRTPSVAPYPEAQAETGETLQAKIDRAVKAYGPLNAGVVIGRPSATGQGAILTFSGSLIIDDGSDIRSLSSNRTTATPPRSTRTHTSNSTTSSLPHNADRINRNTRLSRTPSANHSAFSSQSALPQTPRAPPRTPRRNLPFQPGSVLRTPRKKQARMPLIRSPAHLDLQDEFPQAAPAPAPAAAAPIDGHGYDHHDTEYAPSEYAETEVLSPVAGDNYEEPEPDEPPELSMSRERAFEQWTKIVNNAVARNLAKVRTDEHIYNGALELRARESMKDVCDILLLDDGEDQLYALRGYFHEIIQSTTDEENEIMQSMQDEVDDLLAMDADKLIDLWHEAFLQPDGARMIVLLYMQQLEESLLPEAGPSHTARSRRARSIDQSDCSSESSTTTLGWRRKTGQWLTGQRQLSGYAAPRESQEEDMLRRDKGKRKAEAPLTDEEQPVKYREKEVPILTPSGRQVINPQTRLPMTEISRVPIDLPVWGASGAGSSLTISSMQVHGSSSDVEENHE